MDISVSRPICYCGLVPSPIRLEGKLLNVCPHFVRGYDSRYRAEHKPCDYSQDVDSSDEDRDDDPVPCSRILRRPVWPSHYDVPSSSGDLLARYRSKGSQPTLNNSASGEGSISLLDTGFIPQQQFVMVEQRARAAEATCERQQEQLNTLEAQVADLTLLNEELEMENSTLKTQLGRAETELRNTKAKLVVAEAKLKEQDKSMEDLKSKYNDALEDIEALTDKNRRAEAQAARRGVKKRKASDESGSQLKRPMLTGLKRQANPYPSFRIPSDATSSSRP